MAERQYLPRALNDHKPNHIVARAGDALQRVLDEAVEADPLIPGGVLDVCGPMGRWSGAAGWADPVARTRLEPHDPFLAVSVTKTITAATLLLLVEDGAVDLDRPIERYLPSVVKDLHRLDGRSYAETITLRHALSHTSGLPDYFNDGIPGASGVRPFVALMRSEPDRLWEPRAVVAWVGANLEPKFPPGRGWHYTDTGFVLAGLVAEAVTGQPLHAVMRERIFDRLAMADTYMHLREEPRSSRRRPLATPYRGDAPYTDRSVSADWGGGGLVSTADDLITFMRALMNDELLAHKQTKREMLSWVSTGEVGAEYGLGIRRFDLSCFGLGDGELWGHSGFLKSFLFHWPSRDITLAGTLNQSHAPGAFSTVRPVSVLVRDVVGVLGEVR